MSESDAPVEQATAAPGEKRTVVKLTATVTLPDGRSLELHDWSVDSKNGIVRFQGYADA